MTAALSMELAPEDGVAPASTWCAGELRKASSPRGKPRGPADAAEFGKTVVSVGQTGKVSFGCHIISFVCLRIYIYIYICIYIYTHKYTDR